MVPGLAAESGGWGSGVPTLKGRQGGGGVSLAAETRVWGGSTRGCGLHVLSGGTRIEVPALREGTARVGGKGREGGPAEWGEARGSLWGKGGEQPVPIPWACSGLREGQQRGGGWWPHGSSSPGPGSCLSALCSPFCLPLLCTHRLSPLAVRFWASFLAGGSLRKTASFSVVAARKKLQINF